MVIGWNRIDAIDIDWAGLLLLNAMNYCYYYYIISNAYFLLSKSVIFNVLKNIFVYKRNPKAQQPLGNW